MELHLTRTAGSGPTAILSGGFAPLMRDGPHSLPLRSSWVGRCPKSAATLALVMQRPRLAQAALSAPAQAALSAPARAPGHPLSASLAARVARFARRAQRLSSTTSTTPFASQDHIGRAADSLGCIGYARAASSRVLRPVSAISRLPVIRCTAPCGTVHYITTTRGVKGCANPHSPPSPTLGHWLRDTLPNGHPLGWTGLCVPLQRPSGVRRKTRAVRSAGRWTSMTATTRASCFMTRYS